MLSTVEGAQGPAVPERSQATLWISILVVLGSVLPKVFARFGLLGFSAGNYRHKVYALALSPRAVLDEPWRWLSHIGVHTPVWQLADIAHVAAVVGLLQLLGPAIETRFGSRRFSLAFLGGLLVGALASFAWAPYPGVLGACAGAFAVSGLELGAWLRARGPARPGHSQVWSRLGYLVAIYAGLWILLPHHAELPSDRLVANLAGILLGTLLGACWLGAGSREAVGKGSLKAWAVCACLLIPLLLGAGYRVWQARSLFPEPPADPARWAQLQFPQRALQARRLHAERTALETSTDAAESLFARSRAINEELFALLDALKDLGSSEATFVHDGLWRDLGGEAASNELAELRARIGTVNDRRARIEIELARDFWDLLYGDFVRFLRQPGADLAVQRLDVAVVAGLYFGVKGQADPASFPEGLAALERRHGFQ